MDDDTKARVKRLVDMRHRTAHRPLREAITQYVKREEKRDAFRQDTPKAWEECPIAGRHVTAEEADAWLAQLEPGNDIEPPGCHVWSGPDRRCAMRSTSVPKLIVTPEDPAIQHRIVQLSVNLPEAVVPQLEQHRCFCRMTCAMVQLHFAALNGCACWVGTQHLSWWAVPTYGHFTVDRRRGHLARVNIDPRRQQKSASDDPS